MSKKKTNYNKTSINNLPNDKPAVYQIKTDNGKVNYVGISGKGNLTGRIADHLGTVPGNKVEITQHSSIKEARESEKRIIKWQQPKYNTQDK